MKFFRERGLDGDIIDAVTGAVVGDGFVAGTDIGVTDCTSVLTAIVKGVVPQSL